MLPFRNFLNGNAKRNYCQEVMGREASAISRCAEIDEALLCHACGIKMWSSTAKFEWFNSANGEPPIEKYETCSSGD